MTVRSTPADTLRAEAAPRRLAAYATPLEALTAVDSAERAEAAFALGMQGDGAAVGALRRALQDGEARVRVEAALALARLGEEALGKETLGAELQGEFFAGAPLRAARGLALLGDASGYARVLEALRSEMPSNRLEAVAALPEFAPLGIDVTEPLTQATSDSEEIVRSDALAALRGLQGEDRS